MGNKLVYSLGWVVVAALCIGGLVLFYQIFLQDGDFSSKVSQFESALTTKAADEPEHKPKKPVAKTKKKSLVPPRDGNCPVSEAGFQKILSQRELQELLPNFKGCKVGKSPAYFVCLGKFDVWCVPDGEL